jgi:F-type H+-transporting ATPase subunit b
VELSWSTFLLEAINFLVLVWILKRFLYKPVLDVIERRRAGIEKIQADAEALNAEAEKRQQQYENRLADWSKERQQARDALQQELDAERARRISELRLELEQEREKARVAEATRETNALRLAQETALKQAAVFATRLLDATAGPETHARLVDLVIVDLSQLPADRIEAIRSNHAQTPEVIGVSAAFALADDQRERLEEAMRNLTGLEIPIRFDIDSALMAGVRITVGAWVLGCNLEDELEGMTAIAHGE